MSPSRRHDLLAWAVPTVRRSRDLDDAEVERARVEAAEAPQAPDALTLRADARCLPASVIDDLKHLFLQHPGVAEVVLKLDTSTGPRLLLFGPGFKVKPTPDLRVELDGILGPSPPRPTAGPDDELPEQPEVAAEAEPSMA